MAAWPTIVEDKPSPHSEILHNAAPRSGAIRVGDWKLVINGSHGTAEEQADVGGGEAADKGAKVRNRGERIELFNIAQDPYEKNDLAGQLPERVKELRIRYDALAQQALPPKSRPQPPGFHSPKVWGEK